MRIDLTHNKIIKETVTESFASSFNEGLVPKLKEIFGDSISALQMYEDYLSDNFIKDSYFYYPLTVVTGASVVTCWIKWDISDASKFDAKNPYSYLGQSLDFIIADDVPIAFTNALIGRSIYFEEGNVKLGVSLAAKDVMLLSGKYSQTFIDEMARQLTSKIESAVGLSGLAGSTVELDLFFAPDTYMEHTSENVTYRRLLLSAKGCSPRDFWVKWTRLNSASAYSLKDNVTAADISFDIGEDVSHKIREKEYRFLVYSNSEKYRMAMGRKNITEWRELLKRAQKRGELTKLGTALEDSSHAGEVSDKLAEILQKCGVSVPEVNVSSQVPDSTAEADKALRTVVLGSAAAEKSTREIEDYPQVEFNLDDVIDKPSDDKNEDTVPPFTFSLSEETDNSLAADIAENASAYANVDGTEDASFTDATDAPEADGTEDTEATDISGGYTALTDNADNAADVVNNADTYAEEEPKQVGEDNSFALMIEIEKLEVKLRCEAERYEALLRERELSEKRLDSAIAAAAAANADAEALRASLAELRNELTKEADARALAEDNVSRLSAEIEKNNNDISELLGEIDDLKARLERTAEESRINEEKLRRQLELEEKERLRDKLLFAEAARAAKEESDRLAKERELAEERAAEERERLEAARRLEEEERLAEEARIAERERIENEMREAAQRRENNIARANDLRQRMENEARAFAEAKYGKVTPVSEYEPKDASSDVASTVIAEDNIEADTAVDFSVDETHEPEATELDDEPLSNDDSQPIADASEAVGEVREEIFVQPPRYTYTSKLVRLLFRNAVNEYVTETVKNLITEAIKKFGKEKVYIKMKASVPDSTTVVLDIVQIPEQEIQLLIDIIHHLGNSNIGIYKVIME